MRPDYRGSYQGTVLLDGAGAQRVAVGVHKGDAAAEGVAAGSQVDNRGREGAGRSVGCGANRGSPGNSVPRRTDRSAGSAKS